MASVILFHSVYGLRPVERAMAARLRAAGHAVEVPDLYDGRSVENVQDGFALRDAVGWPVIHARAERAVATLPAETVLAGVSMGAGLVSELWPGRPRTAGVLLLHGPAEVPASAPAGLPVEVHMAEPDEFEDEGFVADWRDQVERAGVALQFYRYPGAGHYFLDRSLPDHDAAAAALAWKRILAFLARV